MFFKCTYVNARRIYLTVGLNDVESVLICVSTCVEKRCFCTRQLLKSRFAMSVPLKPDEAEIISDQESLIGAQSLQVSNQKSIVIPGMIEEELSVTEDAVNTHTTAKNKVMELQTSILVDGRYQNPWPTWKPPTFLNVLRFFMSKNYSKVPSRAKLDELLPVVQPNFKSFTETGMSVTWIGHATTLVHIDGVTVLTDPIFSKRCSPSQLIGPKRYRPPPCTIAELPAVDAVVISHNHYDHLDAGSVTQLNDRFGSSLKWFVPMQLASLMHSMGCENVVELDWWENGTVSEEKKVNLVFTPAQHWSKRTLTNDYKTLWGSWCMIGPQHRFFFAGDTGYCEAFEQIGERYGPFDVAAIPIGAYEPRWFMKFQHANPDDAVQIHEDIRSNRSIGIHWGTFALANEYFLAPPKDLQESLKRRNISSQQFFTLKHGETYTLEDEH